MVLGLRDKLPEAPWTELHELVEAIKQLVAERGPTGGRADLLKIFASLGMPITGLVPLDFGIATGGSPTTLRDSSKYWGANIWPGAHLQMDIGGQRYPVLISSNTSDTITFPTLPGGVQVERGTPYVIANANIALALDVPLSTRASQATLQAVQATLILILTAIGGLVPPPNPSSGVAFTVTCVVPSTAYPVPAFVIPTGYKVLLQGHPNNTGMCYVAFDKVSVLDPTKSRTLVAREDLTLGVANTNSIWLSSNAANQIVSFIVEQT